jgi:hypothetical protein
MSSSRRDEREGMAMRPRIFGLILLAVLVPLVAGAQAEKPITDLAVLAGTWQGDYRTQEGTGCWITVFVRADGSFMTACPLALWFSGTFALSEGNVTYQMSIPEPGTIRLIESNGKERIRFVRADGSVALEAERK